jgi:2-oxoisovalerate dehydrogenase E1 component
MAFGQKLRGTSNITVVFIGDGTLGEGVLYETLNIVSKWQLPLLIVLENNLYAQSTHQNLTLAGDIDARGTAFGISTVRSTTRHPEELLPVAADCVTKVRCQRIPLLLRIDTYRLMAHSKGDDHRNVREVQECNERDPITRYVRESDQQEIRQITAQHAERVDLAVARAEASPYPESVKVDDDLSCSWLSWSPIPTATPERIVNILHAAFQRNMRRDERILLIGEDIEGPYGGAFKVTKNLSSEFPGRVRNTPISEAALVGIGNGLALEGWLPVCEIMFGDFLGLAFDQLLNHAAKFRYMYNEQVCVPVIVRTPMGGKRGYGPTHSQSIEKHFLGLSGTRMLALNSRYDPGQIYDELFLSIDRPSIVIENKLLYGQRLTSQCPDGFALEHSNERFPTIRLRPEASPDVTILCYGGMLTEVESAADRLFERHDIICEVICPIQLYPLNPWPIVESVKKSGRLLTVEEGPSFAAFGAEVIAQIAESANGTPRQVRRLAGPRHPIPSCGELERALLPGEQSVTDSVLELCACG